MDLVLVASYAPAISYPIHRSSIIAGASSRSVYNSLRTLASILQYVGIPFMYRVLDTWEHFCDMSGARVVAVQHIWAAVTAHAKSQTFNCANGNVDTWKSVWTVTCEVFGVEFVPFDENDEFDFEGMMKQKVKVWDEIAEQHGLYNINKVEEITCFEALSNVLHFGFQHVCGMKKSCELGFSEFADALKKS